MEINGDLSYRAMISSILFNFRYLLAISILVFLYSSAQLVRQVHRFSTGRDLVPARAGTIFDFAGDQVNASCSIEFDEKFKIIRVFAAEFSS